jgi:hypothetical protein
MSLFRGVELTLSLADRADQNRSRRVSRRDGRTEREDAQRHWIRQSTGENRSPLEKREKEVEEKDRVRKE